MKIYDEPSWYKDITCPICKTQDNKPIALVKIDGTVDEGKVECFQVHVDCIDLHYISGMGIIYQQI